MDCHWMDASAFAMIKYLEKVGNRIIESFQLEEALRIVESNHNVT